MVLGQADPPVPRLLLERTAPARGRPAGSGARLRRAVTVRRANGGRLADCAHHAWRGVVIRAGRFACQQLELKVLHLAKQTMHD